MLTYKPVVFNQILTSGVNCEKTGKKIRRGAKNVDNCSMLWYNISIQKTEDKHMTVTKESKIGEILDYNMETARYFLEMGMHCLGCPSARSETLEQACFVHGVDPDELVEKINGFLASEG
jgi:hybrid cluster-associated redox disulfide protein